MRAVGIPKGAGCFQPAPRASALSWLRPRPGSSRSLLPRRLWLGGMFCHRHSCTVARTSDFQACALSHSAGGAEIRPHAATSVSVACATAHEQAKFTFMNSKLTTRHHGSRICEMTEPAPSRKPVSAPLMRLLWAAVLALHVFRAQAGVVFTNLHSFTGTNNGANPYAGLVQGSDGNLYGTTSSGGQYNLGTVYKFGTNGALTGLYSFDGTNGAAPYAALVQGADGNFYGTTYAGGVSNLGTIFQFTTNGTLTTLFSFTGTNNPYQGANPGAALVPASDGSFYSTAEYGGLTNASFDGQLFNDHGFGTVFQLTTNGTITVPAVFGNTNGAYPAGGLVRGQDGNFYGTTTWGGRGITGSFPGYGTVFKLTPDGTFTNIYSFTGANDGGFIYAGLVQGRDGYLYGAAFSGGSAYGTLFKVSTNGSFIPLHTFSRSDSGSPYGGLTEGSDGNFYGTTYGYFVGLFGSVFSVTPGGAFTNLVLFNN